ncbi:MAG TPA: GspH/FimT family pseudopilin [Gemmatimonadaceae bacterium]
MRSGHSLIEVLIALALLGALLGFAAPRLGALSDHAVVRGASTELAAMLSAARHAALLRSAPAALLLDGTRGQAMVVAGADTVLARAIASEPGGVRFAATRDTIRYAPSGRGLGASNTTLIVRRGSAADTLWVSRLGRVRW